MKPKYELLYCQPTSDYAALGGFEMDGCYTIKKNGQPILFFEKCGKAQRVFRDLTK